MNAPVADMSLVFTSRTLVLLPVMAFSLTGSLVENLLLRRCSFNDNSFFWGLIKSLINNEYFDYYTQKSCKYKGQTT